MAIVLLCSASGAPGVTVTALGLTLTWPRDVLLVDADRSPSQAVLAGYLRGASAHDLGLPGILQAHRERRPVSEAIDAQSMSLPEPPAPKGVGLGPTRRFLPGFVHPGTADVFSAVWRDLGQALQEAPHDTILDAGRIGSRGLPTDLAEASGTIGVVTRTSLVALAALRLQLPTLLDQVPSGQVGLILVGAGRPYRAKEVAEQFGVGVLAEIAWQPSAAADLQEGQLLSRRWRRQALARSFADAAGRLTTLQDAERASIGTPAPAASPARRREVSVA